jgi:hypothetical protein
MQQPSIHMHLPTLVVTKWLIISFTYPREVTSISYFKQHAKNILNATYWQNIYNVTYWQNIYNVTYWKKFFDAIYWKKAQLSIESYPTKELQ